MKVDIDVWDGDAFRPHCLCAQEQAMTFCYKGMGLDVSLLAFNGK